MKKIIIILIILIPVISFSFFVPINIKAESYTKDIAVFHKNNQLTLVFELKKNENIFVPFRGSVLISAYQTQDFFRNIKKLTSIYGENNFALDTLQLTELQNGIQKTFLKENNLDYIKSLNINPDSLQEKILQKYQKNGLVSLTTLRDNVLIKLSYSIKKIRIPLSIILLNKKLKEISYSYYIFTDSMVGHPLLTTSFTMRFNLNNKTGDNTKNFDFNEITRILPEFNKSRIHLTHLRANLNYAFLSKNITLKKIGNAPKEFTKEMLIKIKNEENFSIKRKLYLTKFLLSGENTASKNESFYRLWNKGEYNQNIPVRNWLNNTVFQLGLPELLVLDVLKNTFNISKWIFFNHSNTILFRSMVNDMGAGYRLLYVKSFNENTLKILLQGYKNLADIKFEDNYFIFSRDRRVIVLRKTDSGIFALDYNGYREENWHLKTYNTEMNSIKTNEMKMLLSKISISEIDQEYIKKYFRPAGA